MRLRVEDLAAQAAVSVDTVRYYQSLGLIDPPEREGRVGWYSDDHLQRLRQIRSLKERGLNLAAIGLLLEGAIDAADAALVSALDSDQPDGEEVDASAFAAETGLPVPVLEALAREGLLSHSGTSSEPRFRRSDAAMVKAGVALLETGLPLDELLALARVHDREMRKVADRAVELFIRFVRDPIRAEVDEEDAGQKMSAAFERMLPATTALVAEHFRRLLLEAARARAGLSRGT